MARSRYCPSIPTVTCARSPAAMAKLRAEIFHRFLFLVMRPAIEACKDGVYINGNYVSPHLLMIVTDQKQERPMLSLKSVGSYRDCSLCTSLSRWCSRDQEAQQSGDNGIAAIADVWENSINNIFETADKGTGNPGEAMGHRNVERTISAALLSCENLSENSANRRGMSQKELREAKGEARNYLTAMSAQPYPTALAAWPGFSSQPCLLYRSVAFDMLHVMDLGILRIIPDHTHEIFSRLEYREHGTKASLIKLLNQRFLDLPRGCNVPRRTVFLTNRDEQQSGMTGQVRRACLPFLWAVLIGLKPNVNPDDDELVQVSLLLNCVYSKMKGINMPSSNQMRSSSDIDKLQDECHELGSLLIRVFNLRMSTKLHRLMFHVRDHLNDFGDFFYGSTGENEALHKDTKSAYQATNRNERTLTKQMINVRAGAESYQRTAHVLKRQTFEEEGDTDSKRLSVVSGKLSSEQNIVVKPNEKEGCLCQQVYESLTKNGRTHPELSETEDAQRQESTMRFIMISRVQIHARYDWMELSPTQTIFACQKTNRFDFVCYKSAEHVMYGEVIRMFKSISSSGPPVYALAVREMWPADPCPGNWKAVEQFGMTRLIYRLKIGTQKFLISIIPLSSVLHRAVVVPDMHRAGQLDSYKRRMNASIRTRQERKDASFFRNSYTSIVFCRLLVVQDVPHVCIASSFFTKRFQDSKTKCFISHGLCNCFSATSTSSAIIQNSFVGLKT